MGHDYRIEVEPQVAGRRFRHDPYATGSLPWQWRVMKGRTPETNWTDASFRLTATWNAWRQIHHLRHVDNVKARSRRRVQKWRIRHGGGV